MAEFPALPLFTDAYLADTKHLTAEEHGAYLLLLMCAWRARGCSLPDDNRYLARTVGVSAVRWRKLRPVLEGFFDIAGGFWTQKKLTEVYAGVQLRVARNRANGARGGLAKARKLGTKGAGGRHADTGDRYSDPSAEKLPAKAKVQTPEPEGQGKQAPGGWRAAVAAAAGLSDRTVREATLVEWSLSGADHPAFLPTDLGPDPRHGMNLAIPDEIYERYSGPWQWRPREGQTPPADKILPKDQTAGDTTC